MIGKTAQRFCNESIENIDNYEQALNDKERTWCIHHKLECGEHPIKRQELIEQGRYYSRPASELMFLPQCIHWQLHNHHRKGKRFNLESWMPRIKVEG